jgi:glycosyltransferase involved in cell wall biosynthesis
LKKRITIIENHFLASSTIRYDLLKNLCENGFEVTVLTKLDESFKREIFDFDVTFIEVGYSSLNPLTAFRYCYNLFKQLRKIKPNVCLTFTIRPAILGNLVTRLLKISTISTITGTGQLFENKTLTYKISRWLYSWVLKKTKFVIFPNNDDLQGFIKRKYISTQQGIRVPGSGINYNNFLPQTRVNNIDGKFHFLFVGRLVKDKGILEYIEAAKYFFDTQENTVFHLLGMIWDMNEKKYGVTQEELDEWIKNKWIVYHKETLNVKEYFANVDCVVLPSYREGLSNVLLEAASMEKAIVTTNVTGCKDVVEDNYNGLLCNVQDVDDLIRKLKTMMSLPKETIALFGKNGRQKVIQEFAKEKVVQKYLDAINKTLYE